MTSTIRLIVGLIIAAGTTMTAAQTRFDHKAPGYVVPEKRVQLAANVTDPKGVQLARVYFKTPAQADYVFVPMTPAGGNRYVATLPAMNASAPSLQYVLLAVNNTGDVSKTQEYMVTTRRSNETPAWQSASNQGRMTVYTEAPTAPQTVAGFSDSISMDVAESTARFGTAAGLLAGGGSGGASAGASAGTTGSTAGTATATAATAGGLSTMAIVGGVAVAGLAAAAASGGGGGGGSGSGTGTGVSAFVGSWSGTSSLSSNSTCSSGTFSSTITCNEARPFTGTVDSSGLFSGTYGVATLTCVSQPGGSTTSFQDQSATFGFSVGSSGTASIPGSSTTFNGINTTCPASTIQLTSSPRRLSGSYACTSSGNGCTGTTTVTWSGS